MQMRSWEAMLYPNVNNQLRLSRHPSVRYCLNIFSNTVLFKMAYIISLTPVFLLITHVDSHGDAYALETAVVMHVTSF